MMLMIFTWLALAVYAFGYPALTWRTQPEAPRWASGHVLLCFILIVFAWKLFGNPFTQ